MRFHFIFVVVLSLCGENWARFSVRRYDRRRNSLDGADLTGGSLVKKDCPYCKERWITQFLNHHNPVETVSWKQRYYANDEFYRENGPIFLMVSGEQTAFPQWLAETASFEAHMAKKFGAMLYYLEHRYYGMSWPTANLSESNLLYLSADQALADTAYFIMSMQCSGDVPAHAKWILFGASYAGTVVAWMRSKYPHLVYGAISNSAPLYAQVDFKDFYLVVESSLKAYSPHCVNVLKNAFKNVHAMLGTVNGRGKLERIFNLCGRHFEEEQTLNDIINFYEGVVDIATEVVFNNDTFDLNIEKACDVLEDTSNGTPLYRLAKLNQMLLKETKKECLSLTKYEDIVLGLKNISWNSNSAWDRRWIYQTCTEFGWYQTTTANPFDIPSDGIPVDMYRQLCHDVFGEKYKEMLQFSTERTNMMFGGLDIAKTATNVVFVHGSNDPWHAAGVTRSNNAKSPVIFVEGGGHCPLIDPPKPNESPNKLKAKRFVEATIAKWLREAGIGSV